MLLGAVVGMEKQLPDSKALGYEECDVMWMGYYGLDNNWVLIRKGISQCGTDFPSLPSNTETEVPGYWCHPSLQVANYSTSHTS